MCGYFKSREPGGNEPTPRANWQWVLIASGELKHCGSFKRGLPDLAGAAAAKKKFGNGIFVLPAANENAGSFRRWSTSMAFV